MKACVTATAPRIFRVSTLCGIHLGFGRRGLEADGDAEMPSRSRDGTAPMSTGTQRADSKRIGRGECIFVRMGDFAERVQKAEAEALQHERAAARPALAHVDEMQELRDSFSEELNAWAKSMGTTVESFELVLRGEYQNVWYSANFVCDGVAFEAFSGRLGRGVPKPLVVKMWGSDIQIKTMEDIGNAMLQRKRFKPPGRYTR